MGKDKNFNISILITTATLYIVLNLVNIPIVNFLSYPLKFILFLVAVRTFLSIPGKTLVIFFITTLIVTIFLSNKYFIPEFFATLTSAYILVFFTQKKLCYLKSLFAAAFLTVVIYWIYFQINPQQYTDLIESYHQLFYL